MNSGWKKFSKGRICKEHENGFLIIKPENSNDAVPLECPLCELLLTDADDLFYYNVYKVCSHCAIKFSEGANKEKWMKENWRPEKEIVEKFKEDRLKVRMKIKLI